MKFVEAAVWSFPASLEVVESVMREVCGDWNVELLVNRLKGVSSRRLQALGLPEIQRRLWKGHLWSPSYFVCSTGGAPLDQVRHHIENQRSPST